MAKTEDLKKIDILCWNIQGLTQVNPTLFPNLTIINRFKI